MTLQTNAEHAALADQPRRRHAHLPVLSDAFSLPETVAQRGHVAPSAPPVRDGADADAGVAALETR